MRPALALPLAASLACLLSSGPEIVSAQVASERSAKVWVGRHQEFEEFIKTEPIVRVENVPLGVTKPRRGFFKPGGPCESVVIKILRPSRDTGFLESYRSEIAAYEVDKLLDLEMVPVTVERSFEGTTASAQLWVNDSVYLKTLKGQPAPDPADWNRQLRRWQVFDDLIGNIDRNEGNLLVVRDPAWHLVLIDHSRAFSNVMKMPFEIARIDRPFFERLKALDKAALDARIGKLVLDGSKSILKRRDAIVAQFEKLAASKGAAQVFTP